MNIAWRQHQMIVEELSQKRAPERGSRWLLKMAPNMVHDLVVRAFEVGSRRYRCKTLKVLMTGVRSGC